MSGRLLPLILSAALAAAGAVTVDLSEQLDRSLELYEALDGTVPSMPGGYAATDEGHPILPVIPLALRLPRGTEASSISSSARWQTVMRDAYIPPLPPPMPLFLDQAAATAVPDESVYSADGFWPAEPVSLSGTGFSGALPHAQLLVRPLRWNPATGELQRVTSLEVSIETAPSSSRPLPSMDTGGFRRMMIVTDQSLETVFQELAERRNDQGIITEVYTMDEVYSTSPGRDDAESLRNFVKDYQAAYGLDFLLLGGDTDLVPFRKAYAMTCEAGFHVREDSLPCDLYFSDLDGTWDANGNEVFGEVDDEVDLYPDVFVGRAPVENLAEAEIFVANISAYEDCLREDHYQNVLFLAEILWWNPYTNSGESKDHIEEEYLPGFLNVTKLYQALGNQNLASTLAAFNEGQNFVNHAGHAWYSSMSVGDGYMGIPDVNSIDSDGRFAATVYSIGCWSAAFDFNAIAEHFLTNPNGCSVGFIGNSSYGWGSPGNPCYGYSDAFDHMFHNYLFSDWSLTTGEALALAKQYFIPYSQWENVYRWHQYTVNLLGDPSLRPYRSAPSVISVNCPDAVTENISWFPVQVSGAPAEGLTVCLRDGGSNWYVAELDGSGYHSFEVAHPPEGSFRVTVTGPGVRRTSVTVPVSAGPQPVVSGISIDDTGGDGTLSPGDLAQVDLTLLNQGTENLTGISLMATLLSGPGTVLEQSMTFPDLLPCSSSMGSQPLELEIFETAVNGDIMRLLLGITAVEGTWSLDLPLMVCSPGLYFTTYTVNDSAGGNGDGIPDPGETFDLTVSIANFGLLGASEVSAVMTDPPSGVVWLSDSAFVDSIQPGVTASFTFTCELSGGFPSPSFPWLYMEMSSQTAGYTSLDSLRLTVGETGIWNDVESGEAGWTHSGTADMWNITSSYSHSPDHSWHCGDSGGYVPNMDCSLYSPELVLAPDAQLTFWAAFDVAIYGSDGLYVIINDIDESSSDTLDFIGSGGALGMSFTGQGTDWVPWTYDLGAWGTGNTVQLEFRFVSDSDSDTGMGFYLDDIGVEGGYTGSTGIEVPAAPAPVLGLPFPNPSGGLFSIPVNVTGPGTWTVSLYDITGRLLLSVDGQSPSTETVRIDGGNLSSGLYFLRLSGAAEASRRLVILR